MNRSTSQLQNSPQRLITILIVEDHELVRVGLRSILNRNAQFEVVGEAGSCQEARVEAARLRPTIILMDLRLPDGSGVEVCREVLSAQPETKVVFLTSYGDDESTLAAVLAGASGYLLKEVGPDRLTQVIEMVGEGHSILDRRVIERIQTWARGKDISPPVGSDWDLTPQQQRILGLVAEGQTNKEIAKILGLSDKTVRNYLVTIFEKLRIQRRGQAAAIYTKRKAHQPSSERSRVQI